MHIELADCIIIIITIFIFIFIIIIFIIIIIIIIINHFFNSPQVERLHIEQAVRIATRPEADDASDLRPGP